YKITTVAGLAVALKTRLNGQVLDSTVSSRIVEFLRSPSEKTFLKVLGDNSLQEMQEYMYGADPLNPSAESLLGQYIKETGAATLVRTFPQTGKARRQGTPKLVVAISSETAKKYHKYFDKPEFLLHYHYPEQGTLQFGQAGVIGSYGSLSRNDFVRFTELGTIVPHIVLKTTEAGRARNFFRLGARNIEIALTPWLLTGYCAMGGYSSCTHWVGNIPIGDEKVESYTFPGKIDRFAHNEVSKKPQTQILQPYNDYVDDKNLTSVWTVPGHMQLWEVLGLRGPQIGGLLASPGFVAHVLSARTSVERVPVVFLVVKDHKAPIPANFPMWTNPI
ncbi:MAG: hypothetical protein KDD38_11365, partial [Bdellovibrionales bacterium]|nr:hypothetical protein [Bdellovibrionales bacterium]